MLDTAAYSSIFFPHLIHRQMAAMSSGMKFVHYTTAQAAMSIVARRRVWLRNVLFMNDFSEVSFGIEAVISYFGSERSKDFWLVVDRLTGGMADKIKADFDSWVPDLRTRTYVCCLSEHDPKENAYGRLSMWRGYGSETGVGIVINPAPIYAQSDALSAYSYPVLYVEANDIPDLFDTIAGSIIGAEDVLKEQSAEEVKLWVLDLLLSLPFYLKHPGFSEEREWRVVHRPTYDPSARLEPKMESVNGFPQRIYELPLEDIPEENLLGLNPKELVDRLIIGPTEHPVALYHAFVDLLSEAGVEEAASKVFVSDIPFRPK